MEHVSKEIQQDGKNIEVAKKIAKIARYILIVTFGLLPVFFIPAMHAPFSYAKTLVVVLALSVSLILFANALIFSGRYGGEIRIPKGIVTIWGVVLVALLSTLFSGDIRDALIGDTFSVHTTVFILLLACTVTMVAFLLQDKVEILRLFLLLTASTAILGTYHILRSLLGADFLSFGIFDTLAQTPLGGWNDLGVFFGLSIVVSLVAMTLLPLTRWGNVLFSVVVTVSLFMIGLVNFKAVWIELGIFAFALSMYTFVRSRLSSQRSLMTLRAQRINHLSLSIPVLVVICSSIFIFYGEGINTYLSEVTNTRYIDVRPSLSATIDIARSVYSEDALLGVGTNRFVDAWTLYRDPAINETIFWNTPFESGNGYVTTTFVTMGILGIIGWVLFFGFIIYTGYMLLLKGVGKNSFWYFIGATSFFGSIYLWIMSIVYVPGPVPLILASVLTGVLYASYLNLFEEEKRGMFTLTFRFRKQQAYALVALVVLFSLWAIYYTMTHYSALYLFNKAVDNGGNEIGFDARIAMLTRAYEKVPSDTFLRHIALYDHARIVSLLSTNTLVETQQQSLINSAVRARDAITDAVVADPTDARNHRVKGMLYSAFTLMAPVEENNAYVLAQEAFESARRLDPLNPFNQYLEAELELRNGNIDMAQSRISEAITLNPFYVDALSLKSQIDIRAGDVDSAIENTVRSILISPNDSALHYRLGVLYSSIGDITSAIEAFESAIAIHPNFANARYFLALAYVEVGRHEDALTELEYIQIRNPNNATLEEVIQRVRNGDPLEGDARIREEISGVRTLELDGTATTTNTAIQESGDSSEEMVTPRMPEVSPSEVSPLVTGGVE